MDLIFDETGNDDVRVDVSFEDVMYRLQDPLQRRVEDLGDRALIQMAGQSAFLDRNSGDQGDGGRLEVTLLVHGHQVGQSSVDARRPAA